MFAVPCFSGHGVDKERIVMKRLLASAFATCMLCAAVPAAAEPPGPRGERMARPEGAAPARERLRPPAREASWPQRQRRAEGQEEQGGGRMSPEERRQLRRDISAHGRDIYRESKE